MKRTARITSKTLITLIIVILYMYRTPIAAELTLFSPFDNQHGSAPPRSNAAAEAIDRFDLVRPELSKTTPLTRDDAIGVLTDTPVAGDDSQERIARLISLKEIYKLGTDPVFDTNWEGFADLLAGSDIWKDSFSSTEPGIRIEETLTLLSTDSREIRKMFMRVMAEQRNRLRTHARGHATAPSAYTETYSTPDDEPLPEPKQEYETERIRASDEEDGLFFGFNLDTTTIILLGVGILVVAVVCKRLPY